MVGIAGAVPLLNQALVKSVHSFCIKKISHLSHFISIKVIITLSEIDYSLSHTKIVY